MISPTSEIPCAMVWRPWQGSFLNRTGYGTVWTAWRFIDQALKPHRKRLGLSDMPPLSQNRTHLGQALPRITSTSPALIEQKPVDWKANDYLLAYPSLDEAAPDSLPAHVRSFVTAGAAPVFISLGSLESETPADLLDTVLGVLDRFGARVIISEALARRLPAEQVATHCIAGHVPHAALFPLCAGIIHHGGAGTTDTALRAGIPQLVLPRRLDQFWHAHRLQEIGIAPAPVTKWSGGTDAVSRALDFLYRPEVRQRAKDLAAELRPRDGALELAELTISETERFRRNVK